MRKTTDRPRAAGSLRFRIELTLGVLSALMLALTLSWPQWIETVFGADPDGGNGQAEWGFTAALCAFTVVMLLAARRDWRRTALARNAG